MFLKLSKENIKYYLVVCIGIAVFMWVLSIYSLWTSSEYTFAKQFLATDSFSTENIGSLKSDCPGLINFKRNYSAGTWDSQFQIFVKGEKASGAVVFRLVSEGDRWVIKKAIFENENGSTIELFANQHVNVESADKLFDGLLQSTLPDKTKQSIKDAKEDFNLVLNGKLPKYAKPDGLILDGGSRLFSHASYRLTARRKAMNLNGSIVFEYGPIIEFNDSKISDKPISKLKIYSVEELKKFLGDQF